MKHGRLARFFPPIEAFGLMRRSAYSFLELVILLAIVTLVAGIVAPRIGSATARYRADYAAKQIVADLARTRANARLTGLTQSCTFNLSNHTYAVTGSTSGLSAAFAINLTGDPFLATISTANFGGSNAASFNRYGEAVSSGTVKIAVGATTRTITLNGSTAVASWQ